VSAVSEPAIAVEDLHRRYGAREAVRSLSFTVEHGEVFALLGPNGAGKTTTVEILEGYRRRNAGTVRVLGVDPEHGGPALRERIGIVLQTVGLDLELTVGETLTLYASCYAAPRPIDALLDEFDLTALRRRRVHHLSGGERRRLEIAIALVGDPEVVFLDEPTTGLDPAARRRAWDTIAGLRRAGRTIILTSHYMDEVEYLADRLLVMTRGRGVAAGAPAALRAGGHRPTTVAFNLLGETRLPDDLAAIAQPGPDGKVQLLTDDAVRVVHRLTGWALSVDVELSGLAVFEPSLEDVYLELTAEHTEAISGAS